MKPIKVPKTPRKAFNPGRPPSSLLLGQIEHLEWAALPASQRDQERSEARTRRMKQRIRTEAQAAERVQQLTELVLANARAAAEPRPAGTAPLPPVELPPLPKAPRARGRRKAARKSSARTTTRSRSRRRPTRRSKRRSRR